MIFSYLKTAFRTFKRHKSSFLINVVGLSIGMACSILIFLWVFDELQYDRFHEDTDQIVQVMLNLEYSHGREVLIVTPTPLAPSLKQEMPEFEHVASYTYNFEYLFTKDNVSLKESGLYAQPDFFHILDINLLHGNRSNLISSPKSVAISKETALKYFNRENVVGESITIDGSEVHTITGVFEGLPDNSSFQFDYVLPFEDWPEYSDSWGQTSARTIAKVNPGTDLEVLNSKISNYLDKYYDEQSTTILFAYPFADQYLYGQFENGEVVGGRIGNVRLFSIVAVFILLIACINFMNLSTAKATKRAKEVGIRKAIGAGKSSLIGQFIGESMIITFFSLMVSILLVQLSLPSFENLMGKTIELNYLNPMLLMLLLGTALITGLIAGSYPAFYLSSFEAVKTLKGAIKSSAGEVFARRGLVVFQFALSVILIISTLVVYQQIQYSQNKNLGYQKENLIRFDIEGDIGENWSAFKNEVKNVRGVKNAARTVNTFLSSNSTTNSLEWSNSKPEEKVRFEVLSLDYEFIETMGFELKAGRTYSEEFGNERSRVLINEEAAEVMGMDNPVGQTLTFWGSEVEIIGVVKNFHFQSVHEKISPAIIRLLTLGTMTYVRLDSDDIQATIAGIQNVYKRFNPEYPFVYEFMDQEYAALYRSEQRVGEMAKYFAFFGILISCLGLFGLSAFTAEQRTKEISVRKVLGATVQNIVLLLTKDFTKLVVLSIGIALPISWLIMSRWIETFAYSTEIQWWVFVGAGLLAIVVAWLTVSWQSIKAALMNPIDGLKRE